MEDSLLVQDDRGDMDFAAGFDKIAAALLAAIPRVVTDPGAQSKRTARFPGRPILSFLSAD